MLEATLTPARFPKPLKLATLLIGLTVPLLVSAGTIIQLARFIIGSAVRFDRYAIKLKFSLVLFLLFYETALTWSKMKGNTRTNKKQAQTKGVLNLTANKSPNPKERLSS